MVIVPLLTVNEWCITIYGFNPISILANSGGDIQQAGFLIFIRKKPVYIKANTLNFLHCLWVSILTSNYVVIVILTTIAIARHSVLKADPGTTGLGVGIGKTLVKGVLKKKIGPKAFYFCTACVVATTAYIGLHDAVYSENMFAKIKQKVDFPNTVGKQIYPPSLFVSDPYIFIRPEITGKITFPNYEGNFINQDFRSLFEAWNGCPETTRGKFLPANEVTPELMDVKLGQILEDHGLGDIDVGQIPRPNYSATNPENLGSQNAKLVNKIAPSFCKNYKNLQMTKLYQENHGIARTEWIVTPEGKVKPVNFDINNHEILS